MGTWCRSPEPRHAHKVLSLNRAALLGTKALNLLFLTSATARQKEETALRRYFTMLTANHDRQLDV